MDRSRSAVVESRLSLPAEMAAGDLGDARLNARRDRLIETLERHPDVSFPEACGGDSAAEALYRFLRNRRVSLDTVIAPHLEATRARCQALGDVLVIHDTTEMSFAGEQPRAGLSRQSARRQGFWVHAALAVSAEGVRAPVGLLALQPFVRTPRAPKIAKPSPHARFLDPTKESRRWADGVTAVRMRLAPATAALHLMDREGDSYELLALLIRQGDRFVVRLRHDRRVEAEDGELAKLSAVLPRTAPLSERQVVLSPRRGGDRSPAARQLHPPRPGRTATLRFAARRLTLQRPADLDASHAASLAVHVVYGWEVDPPPGEVPVEWRLVTTEPIDTVDQVLQVVDAYRTRWLIEEYFKALKTGCAYEQRQLESLDTLLVALGLLAPIAWQLLLLRHLSRDHAETSAAVVFTPRRLQVLRASSAGPTLPPRPTVQHALLAVARLGGHLRQNGAPGWLVLTRGLQTLITMEAGWAAAQHAARCDQS